ncbi:HalOD1 output domain-containing protein [Halonotius pteroides]|uniref:HalOD1 output domain-containing protein n=1 Tax=Halonotius pteroides TaxID=268735 RepID=UPI001403E69C|nr:HalOD1 output domain-containing protein [Halonotius pteroides]
MKENCERLTDVEPAYDSPGLVDRVGYDPTTETYHALHDWTSDSPLSITVVEALATATGDEPTEMRPIHSVIDTDALDRVLSRDDTVMLSFTWEDHDVQVSSSGEIIVSR